MMFFPIYLSTKGSWSRSEFGLHEKKLNREYTEKYGPITQWNPGSGKFREVVRGGNIFLKCRISCLEIPKCTI